jgi:hypothetical protein
VNYTDISKIATISEPPKEELLNVTDRKMRRNSIKSPCRYIISLSTSFD